MPDDHQPTATGSTAADAQARETRRAYDRIAPLYDLLDGIYERSWKRKLRAELFRHARGRILDAGVGTGCNMPFYPAGSEVVGVDTSERMLGRARQRARELGREVSLRPMNLLSLDFPDASFDTVAVTFVLLCLPDELQEPALRELRRVTKPDGRVLLLDYRMSEKPGLRLWMRCLSPWLKWAFAGRFDATTDRYLDTAGLQVLEQRACMGDGVTLTVLKPSNAEAPRRSAA
jgi:phosphatidylethanolamine/phosphatidyl-N-methylethanolamine N-methyltransferase